MIKNKVSSETFISFLLSLSAFILLSFLFFASNRGLDITDEGGYLSDMKYPSSVVSSISLYYVSLSKIFSLVHSSVFTIRCVNVVSIFLSGLFLGWSLSNILPRISSVQHTKSFTINTSLFIAIGSLLYFYRGGLLTPSYNTFVCLGINLTAGLWLQYLIGPKFNKLITSRDLTIALLAGVISCLLLISKPTTGFLVAAFWALSFLVKEHRFSKFFNVSCYFMIGVLIGFILFIPLSKSSINVVINGLTTASFSKHNISFLITFYAFDLWHHLSVLLAEHLLLIGLIVLSCFYLNLSTINWSYILVVPLLLLFLINHFIDYGLNISGGKFIFYIFQFYLFWVLLAVALFLCFKKNIVTSSSLVLIMCGLLILPVFGAFGTANPLTINMLMCLGPWFGLIALVFYVLQKNQKLKYLFLMFILTIVVFILMQIFSAFTDNPYRIKKGVFDQQTRILIDAKGNSLFVDQPTAAFINHFKNDLIQCGVTDKSFMLALVDMPGLVYLSGAKPLGTAWYLGNRNTGGRREDIHKYNGFIISLVSKEQLNKAYILEKVEDLGYLPDYFFNLVDFPNSYSLCSQLKWPVDQTTIRLWKPHYE